MSKTFGAVILAVAFMGVAGCQESRRGVEVSIAGEGGFPEFMVGKWVDEKENWEFVFEPDGRISTSVLPLGKVRIVPGEVTRFPTRFDCIARRPAGYAPSAPCRPTWAGPAAAVTPVLRSSTRRPPGAAARSPC